MAQDDVRKDLRELRDQIEALRETLAQVTQPYADLLAYLERFQDVSRAYFRLLDLYARHGSVSPDLVIPGLQDDIARHIVTALFEKGDRNISQIADAVKAKRGTASRRIVRERIRDLEAKGIVVAASASHGKTYRIAEEIAAKWSDVLMPRPPKPAGKAERAEDRRSSD